MLAILLLFSLLLVPFAAAQNSTTGIHAVPSGLGTVDATLRSQWCTSQRNTCFELCGGRQYTASSTCDDTTLAWNCTCQNGKEPDNLEGYLGTMPELECQQVYQVCNQNNPGAQTCASARSKCGTLDPTTVKAGAGASVSSSAAASTTPPATSTATTATPSATGAAVARFMPEMGVAAGVVAAMGVLL